MVVVVPVPKLTPPLVELSTTFPAMSRFLLIFNNPLAFKVIVFVDTLVKSALTLIFPPSDEERV